MENIKEIFENADGKNFRIKSLKETITRALEAHPEWRKARVIIYREASESANFACEARIAVEGDETPYDGNGNIDDAIERDGSALVLVDWKFPDTKKAHDPITIGELMDVLSKENVNLDASVLCHFEVKDQSEEAYAVRFVTDYCQAPYDGGNTIESAIEDDGVVLIIADWVFPDVEEDDE